MKYLENTMLTQLWDKIRRTFQTQTDNSLKTISKTVVGAINELNTVASDHLTEDEVANLWDIVGRRADFNNDFNSDF